MDLSEIVDVEPEGEEEEEATEEDVACTKELATEGSGVEVAITAEDPEGEIVNTKART